MKQHTIYTRTLRLVFLFPVFLCFFSCANVAPIGSKEYTVIEVIQVDDPPSSERGGWVYKKINPYLNFATCFKGIDILTEGESDPEWAWEGIRAHFLVTYKNVNYLLIMRVTKHTFGLFAVPTIHDPSEIPAAGEWIRDFDSPRLYTCLEAMLQAKEAILKHKSSH